MTSSTDAVHIDLPVGWVPLPPTGTDQAAWVDEYVTALELEEATANSLRFGLLAVMETAASLRAGERQSYAFIDDPTSGMVRALLSVQAWSIAADQRDRYRQHLESGNADERIEVINQTFEERELALGPALVMHDFAVATADGEQPIPALERGVVALFVEDSEAMIEFSLYTQDLLLFDDMTAYLAELADSLVTLQENPAPKDSTQG